LDKGQEEDRSWRSTGSQVWGPTTGRREQQQQWEEERHEHSEMLCLGHYAGQCPKKKKKHQDVSVAIAEEIDFSDQFARECAFMTTLSVITPSNTRWGDKVDED
jgi:hypothetical protein